ncbi:SCP2 sterol-binding domain-containing protein [Parendozoicomonas haliclonae]|uniref:SCP2 domain-containing protein n=1 Tax=Parendozoicomonas haliclonae TaxID=1960125 RepID=A0A1X7APR0_9GAMM|nr:hypothetical protein [Parendozoicomonas haliclonae]SMA50311.1 hypothetical protein EHSB41UT_04105 [Parendozoicomonas haliclonae]
MKFRLLLIGLGFLMKRASSNNPAFIKKLEGKDMSFEISSDDGVCRAFRVKDNKVSSSGGQAKDPEFCLRFNTAEEGFKALTAKNAQLAFMKGIQDKTIRVEGNPMSLMWFQGIAGMVVPKKKKKKKKEAA